MLTIASQTFANGTWTITPAEPATLQIALVGLATLAVYAVVTGWRPGRTAVVARFDADNDLSQVAGGAEGTARRRAA
jgi:hypothetical protein